MAKLDNPYDQTRKFQFVNKVKNIMPLDNTVIVGDMSFGERFTSSGIIIPGDDGKASGIRPRWGRVYAVGPNQHDVQVGEWICIAHGRWSRGLEVETEEGKFTLRRVDPKDIMLSSDTRPNDDTMSTAITGTP
jgi:co-chaperonin GroES (HSP10)